MKILESFPEIHQLTIQDEYKLLKDRELETLILHNMREAVVYAQRCSKGMIPVDELVSLCYAALEHASRNFKPCGTRFFAYSKVYVRGAVSAEWRFKNVVRGAQTEALDVEEGAGDEGVSRQEATVEPGYDEINLREQWSDVEPIIAEHLSQHERMILNLRHVSGFSFQKISDQLEVSREAVRCAHDRALRKIRNVLLESKRLYV